MANTTRAAIRNTPDTRTAAASEASTAAAPQCLAEARSQAQNAAAQNTDSV